MKLLAEAFFKQASYPKLDGPIGLLIVSRLANNDLSDNKVTEKVWWTRVDIESQVLFRLFATFNLIMLA